MACCGGGRSFSPNQIRQQAQQPQPQQQMVQAPKPPPANYTPGVVSPGYAQQSNPNRTTI